MKTLISGHRALFGIASVLFLTLLFATLAVPAASTALEIAFVVLAALGVYGIVGSPYWPIIYREAPLKRAMTGVSDLDERELALRDRAAGLTYNLFAAANIIGLALAMSAIRWRWIAVDAGSLAAALAPYCWFAFTLPVIMLEWFEPSGTWAGPVDEEEA